MFTLDSPNLFFPSLGYPCRHTVYNRRRLNYSLTFCSPHSSLKILEQYTTHNYLQRRQVTKPSNWTCWNQQARARGCSNSPRKPRKRPQHHISPYLHHRIFSSTFHTIIAPQTLSLHLTHNQRVRIKVPTHTAVQLPLHERNKQAEFLDPLPCSLPIPSTGLRNPKLCSKFTPKSGRHSKQSKLFSFLLWNRLSQVTTKKMEMEQRTEARAVHQPVVRVNLQACHPT